MKSFKIKDKDGNTYWLSKEPVCFINSRQVQFKGGEIADWDKYLHREGRPAYIDRYGNKSWWFNGKTHRENGPAAEPSNSSNGDKFWWWHGECVNVFSQEEFELWKRFGKFV